MESWSSPKFIICSSYLNLWVSQAELCNYKQKGPARRGQDSRMREGKKTWARERTAIKGRGESYEWSWPVKKPSVPELPKCYPHPWQYFQFGFLSQFHSSEIPGRNKKSRKETKLICKEQAPKKHKRMIEIAKQVRSSSASRRPINKTILRKNCTKSYTQM